MAQSPCHFLRARGCTYLFVNRYNCGTSTKNHRLRDADLDQSFKIKFQDKVARENTNGAWNLTRIPKYHIIGYLNSAEGALYDYQYIVLISRLETRSTHIRKFRCRAFTYTHHVQNQYTGRWAAKIISMNIFKRLKQRKNTLITNNCIIAKKTKKKNEKTKFPRKKMEKKTKNIKIKIKPKYHEKTKKKEIYKKQT